VRWHLYEGAANGPAVGVYGEGSVLLGGGRPTGPLGELIPTLSSAEREVKVREPAWDQWFSDPSIGRAGPYRIASGRLAEGTNQDIPPAVRAWAHQLHVHREADGTRVVAIRRLEPPVRDRWGLHLGLFFAALVSATVAGGFLEGVDPLGTRFNNVGGTWVPVPTRIDVGLLREGLPFSVAFIGILLAHELGHYLAARRHRIAVSLPYFLPFPPYLSIVGTLGAFIRLRGPIVRRSVLFDVGVAGPLVSFLLSLPLLWAGLRLSRVVEVADVGRYPFVIQFLGDPMRVGTSPLLDVFAAWAVPGFEAGAGIGLHPLAFAGWLGVFVTALNLLPLGQLDGGHVLYAMLGRRQRWLAWGFLALMVPLGLAWKGWWIWGAIAVIVSRGRVAHPPVLMDEAPVGRWRMTLGILALAIFAVTFSPAPLAL